MKPCGSSGDAVTKFGSAPASGTMASPKSTMVHRVIAKQLMFARLVSTLGKDHLLIHHLPIPGSTNVPHQVQNVPMSRSPVSESMSICHLPGLLRRSRIGWCYADLGVARLGSTSGGL